MSVCIVLEYGNVCIDRDFIIYRDSDRFYEAPPTGLEKMFTAFIME